jgi:hypothetical protein
VISGGWAPSTTVRAFRRYGDWLDPRNVRGLGAPLAEAVTGNGGDADFGPVSLDQGVPLWLVGTAPDGSPRAVRSSAPGDWKGRKESVPHGAAQQSQSQAVSQHVRADELSTVQPTAVHGPRTSRDAKPKGVDPEVLERARRQLKRQRLEALTVPQLKRELARRGLAVSGRKGELVERLDGAVPEGPAGRAKPTRRDRAPRPEEVGGGPLPQGPGYDDDLGSAA